MDGPSNVDTHHPVGQIANKTMPSPPEPSTIASASVLKNAKHTRINNSSFRITTLTIHLNAIHVLFAVLLVFLGLVYSPAKCTIRWSSADTGGDVGSETVTSMDPLYKSVAPNAILNAGGRADEVRCHPGTREEVIGLIETFMNAQDKGTPRMLWLSGPAGAGKTAIMQTVAERCKERGVPHANFFFFRTDGSRNDATPFVATLVYQIIQFYPSMANVVAATLHANPLIFQTDLQEQFDMLMHLPLTAAENSLSVRRPIVLLIDGLDECDSERKTAQRQILQELDTLLLQGGISFRVIISSRVEPQISMAFNQLHSHVDSIFLDDQYSPATDIRLFVTAEFEKIKSTHYLAHTLSTDWPSALDVDGIVIESSGQFIYAATVMRFIAHSPASPVLSLQKVRGIVPPAKNSPFAHLDAVYTYILEQSDDADAVMSILASTLAARDPDVARIKICLKAYHPRYSEELVDSSVAELSPISQIHEGRLRFFHASFADFLQDKSRAGRFHIDLEAFCVGIFQKLYTKGDSVLCHFEMFGSHQSQTPLIRANFMHVQPSPIIRPAVTYCPGRKCARY
ncbi:hypothetical protein D9619_009499 [Psilocybe cf. subviscida]|uniref:NACHT domain-containing protein n=1 Tax=Psilocybe cf. subviscida TaxID=2480587 RepID=A0A8H5FAN4_9AGAR|nr:hypothetical protein D9619_009499 [Psilocybe cf. subviscida]